MLHSLLIAIGGIVGLMFVWLLVQNLWKKTFADYVSEEDALADRSKCGNCNCSTACSNKLKGERVKLKGDAGSADRSTALARS